MQKQTLIVSFLFFVSLTAGNIFAQDSNKKIHLKVIKNGEISIDTSFTAENLEGSDLHKKISELAGVDIDLHKSHEGHMHMVHDGEHGNHTWTSHEKKGNKVIIMKSDSDEDDDGKSKKVTYFYSTGDDDNFSMKNDSSFIIDADTIIIKKHGKVIVIDGDDNDFEGTSKETGKKEKDVEITVIKSDGTEGQEVFIVKTGEPEDGEKVIIKKIEGDDSTKVHKIKVIKVQKGDGDEEKTTVYYMSGAEDETEIHESENVFVFISDGENKSMKNKSVKVSKSEGDGDIIEITVEIEEGEEVKFEDKTTKKSKKTKQKKEKKRTSK